MTNRQQKKSGFGLMEALMALSIAAVVAYLLSTTLSNSMKSQKAVETRADTNLLVDSLMSILQNTTTCDVALQGQTIVVGGTNPGVQMKMPDGGVVKQGYAIRPGVTVSSLSIVDTGAAAVPVKLLSSGTTYNRHTVKVSVQASVDPNLDISGPKVLPPKSLTVNVLVDPATKIIARCNQEISVAQVCQDAGGDYDETRPPAKRCIFQACKNGGAYAVTTGDRFAPKDIANPANGAKSCPSGYTAFPINTLNEQQGYACACGKGGCATCYHNQTTTTYSCMNCS